MRAHSAWMARQARLSAPQADGYHPERAAALLHRLVLPATLIDPRQADEAAATLARVVASPDWRHGLDAVHDHARFYDVLHAPAALADALAALRAGAALGDSPVRAAQATLGIARTLASGASITTLAATADRAAELPLSGASLTIAGAHAVPLVTLPTAEVAVATRLALNLLQWQAQAETRRRSWSAERAAQSHRVRADGADDFDEIVHAREEVNTLAGIVERVSRHEATEVPEALSLDRALSDVAELLARYALPRWLAVAPVAVPLLSFLAGSRTSRPAVPGLVRDALARDDLPADVQRAVVALAARKLTGLTREEAWLGTEGVQRVSRGDESARALDDVEALLEADGQLRDTLWRFGLRAGAEEAARLDAIRAVLGALPSNRVARLAEALSGDDVSRRGALDWVIMAREHGAYDVLAAWKPPASHRARWYLALASTGDQRAMAVLTPLLARGDGEAEQAALQAGMKRAAAQVRLRREIESRRAPLAAAFDSAHAEAVRAREALDRATRAGADVANERLRATARRALIDTRVVEAAVESAGFSVRLEPVLVLAERLTRRLEDEKRRLAEAADRLAACHRSLDRAQATARQVQSAMERTRREIAELRDELAGAQRAVGKAQSRMQSADRRVDGAKRQLDEAQAEVYRASSEQATRRAQGRVRTAGQRLDEALSELGSARRDLESAECSARSLGHALEAASERLRGLERQADIVAAQVSELQRELAAARAHADRCQRTAEATARELADAQRRVAAIRQEAERAAALRAQDLAAERAALEQILGRAHAAEAREVEAAREAHLAAARRKAAEQDAQVLTQLDMAALAQHEADMAPAAEELARLDVAQHARSEEAARRARAVQALAVSADVLYCLLKGIDGVARPIQPYARRLSGQGAQP